MTLMTEKDLWSDLQQDTRDDSGGPTDYMNWMVGRFPPDIREMLDQPDRPRVAEYRDVPRFMDHVWNVAPSTKRLAELTAKRDKALADAAAALGAPLTAETMAGAYNPRDNYHPDVMRELEAERVREYPKLNAAERTLVDRLASADAEFKAYLNTPEGRRVRDVHTYLHFFFTNEVKSGSRQKVATDSERRRAVLGALAGRTNPEDGLSKTQLEPLVKLSDKPLRDLLGEMVADGTLPAPVKVGKGAAAPRLYYLRDGS